MFGNKEINSKVLVMGIVAMFLMTGAVCCFESDAASDDNTYTVNLFTGSHYEYKPTVNITTGTTTFTATGLSTGMSFSNNTLTFDAPSTQNTSYPTVTITATWTSNGAPGVTQTASQKINFKVYQTPTFGTIEDKQVFSNTESGTTVASGSISPTTATITSVEVRNSSNAISNEFTATKSGSTFQIKTAKTDLTPGTYTATVKGTLAISNGSNANANAIETSVTQTFNITVKAGASDATISPTYFEAYNGQTDSGSTSTVVTRDIVYTPTTMTDAVITVKSSDNTDVIPTNQTISGTNKIKFDTNKQIVTDPTGRTYNFTLNLKSTNMNVDKDFNCTLVMFPALAFTKAPTIASFSANAGGNNGLTVNTDLRFEGGTKIVYNWGDGTPAETVDLNEISNNHTYSHNYTKEGFYTITVEVQNSKGSATSSYSYNASTGESADQPVAKITSKTVTEENGTKSLVLDSASSTVPEGCTCQWFKGTDITGTPLSTNDTYSVALSTLKDGDVFTLVVKNADGTLTSQVSYTYKQTDDGAASTDPVSDFVKKLTSFDHQTIFLLVAALGIIFAIIGVIAGVPAISVIGGLAALVSLALMYLGY